MSVKVEGHREFKQMNDFTFSYPVFEGWEKETVEFRKGDFYKLKNRYSGVCNIKFPSSRKNSKKYLLLTATKIPLSFSDCYPSGDAKAWLNAGLRDAERKENKNGVMYERNLMDSSSVTFYGKAFSVRITFSEKNPSVSDAFWKEIIKSFKFI
ncbi:MAG: hypothetical protein ABII22_00690 [Candidatus Micrarchaeota archaeon]